MLISRITGFATLGCSVFLGGCLLPLTFQEVIIHIWRVIFLQLTRHWKIKYMDVQTRKMYCYVIIFFYNNRHKYVTLFKVLWLIHGILQGCRINPLLFKLFISHFTIRQNRKRKDRFIQIYSTFRYPFLTAVAYSNGYINTCEIGLHAECTHVGPSCQ